MVELIFILSNLKELDENTKTELNKLLLNKKEELDNDPINTIINTLEEIINVKGELKIFEEVLSEREILEKMNKNKAIQDLFLNYDYINCLSNVVERYNISEDAEFNDLRVEIGFIEYNVFGNINLFFDGLYDYASSKSDESKNYIYEEDETVTLYFTYNHNEYKLTSHPNSELGTTCCMSYGEPYINIINFEDVKEYFTKLDKKENPTRKRDKED